MGVAGAFVIRLNPPESAQQVEYEDWVEGQIHVSTLPLKEDSLERTRDIRITLNEVRAHKPVGSPTPEIHHPSETVTIAGPISAAPVVRLLELAREAKLFRHEPISEDAATEGYPVVGVTIEGYGRDGAPVQFRYRGRKDDFESSIPARLLKTLARMWGREQTAEEE
jgi:hypothetical protein